MQKTTNQPTVITRFGDVIPESEAVLIEGGYYLHQDSSDYGTDEETGLNWPASLICRAYGRQCQLINTFSGDTVRINGDYYHVNHLCDNGIVLTEEGDYLEECDAYYWSSDGRYHTYCESRGLLWDYSAGPKERDLRNGARFGFGVEIEKNALPPFRFDKVQFYDLTGAVLERDGSVSQGFELKTPIYDLLSPATEARLEAFRPYCEVQDNTNAGGHIGFSVEGDNDVKVLNNVRGFLPLIYAMYPARLRNSYCTAKKATQLIRDRDRFQAVNLRGNYIEFRIFPAVWNYETLVFRFRLMQQIAKNYGKSFYVILTQLITEGTELNKLFRGTMYADNDKFLRLIRRAITNDKTFGTNKLSADKIREIEAAIRAGLKPRNDDDATAAVTA